MSGCGDRTEKIAQSPGNVVGKLIDEEMSAG
jgi:hypothetical protein